MKISFWNDKSDNVTTGESYSISGLVVRSFEGGLVLNTTTDTTCKSIPPIKIVHDAKALFDEKTHNVYIQQIHVSDLRRCQACHQKMEVNTEHVTVRCSACMTKQRTTELKKTLTASLTIQDEQNNVSKFFVSQHVLHDFLQSCNKESLINEADELEDFFLEIKNIKITHANDSDAVTKIDKVN